MNTVVSTRNKRRLSHLIDSAQLPACDNRRLYFVYYRVMPAGGGVEARPAAALFPVFAVVQFRHNPRRFPTPGDHRRKLTIESANCKMKISNEYTSTVPVKIS